MLAFVATQAISVRAEDDAIERHKQDLADVERRVLDLEKDLGARRGRREGLVAELEKSERDIADLARAGHRLTAMVDEQQLALEKLRDQLASERESLGRERAALGGLLRSAYALGPGERLRMLLDQEDSNRLSRIMAYYDYLNRYQVKRVEAVAQRARKLAGLMQTAEEERARLVSLAQKQEETRRRLVAAQESRTALLTSLDQTIATRADGIEELRTQARDMRVLLEQLELRARALPEAELRQEPLKTLRGRLSWPLPGARLLSRYGSPKGDGAQRWDGVLLKAEEGTEVRAIYQGQVAYADWLRGFGLLLIIEHDEEYMTLYGHNQTLLKEPGEWVATGETIALSGSSGGRSSPGLYFAIRHRGQPVNPEQWCRRKVGMGSESSNPGSPVAERAGISSLQSKKLWRTVGSRCAHCAADSRGHFQAKSL